MSAETATYYDILQVSRRARPEGVRAAYRRLAQRYHPDKMPGNADAQRVMAALNEAYAVLSDPQQRARYDQVIAQAQSQRRLARQHLLERLDDPGAAWPWYLLLATVAFCTAAVGVVAYKNYVPGASTPAHAVSTAAAASPAPASRPLKLVSN
ncbi:DnaJ domain-containing protein [Ramlibacter tataouinensis]|nr:DnaJ domain-containing protein [Ramlibacter tataouinensis]